MTKEELIIEQANIENEIMLCAEKNNLLTPELKPIPDGIYDAEKYLSSSPRVLWILKEPYDDFTPGGKPCGGGWSLYEAYDNEDAWKNRTWQPMIYITYGILNHLKWEDMSYIRDDISMVEVLKQIAYINVSKMPALKQTIESDLYEYYNLWRSILLKQIEVYAPQIIIFGNTFKYFKDDLIGNFVEPTKKIDGVVHIYKRENTLLFDAYHPNQKAVGRDIYVNTIIENCI